MKHTIADNGLQAIALGMFNNSFSSLTMRLWGCVYYYQCLPVVALHVAICYRVERVYPTAKWLSSPRNYTPEPAIVAVSSGNCHYYVFQHFGNWHVSKMLYLLIHLFHAALVLKKGDDPLTASHPPYSSTGKKALDGGTQQGPEKTIRDGERAQPFMLSNSLLWK